MKKNILALFILFSVCYISVFSQIRAEMEWPSGPNQATLGVEELPSGNLLFVLYDGSNLRCITTTPNFHPINQRVNSVTPFYLYQAETFYKNDHIYLAAVTESYMEGQLSILMLDTNGILQKAVRVTNMATYSADMGIFHLGPDSLVLAMNDYNRGGISLVKLPADLNLGNSAQSFHYSFPQYGTADVVQIDAGDNQDGFPALASVRQWGPDSAIVSLWEIMGNDLQIVEAREWKVPHASDGQAWGYPPVHAESDSGGYAAVFLNMHLSHVPSPVNGPGVAAQILPDGHIITHFWRNEAGESVINFKVPNTIETGLVLGQPADTAYTLYNNGNISTDKVGEHLFYGYSTQDDVLQVETFTAQNVQDCHAFGSVYEPVPLPYLGMPQTLSPISFVGTLAEMNVTQSLFQDYPARNYLCDPNHLTVEETLSLSAMELFPNPAGSQVTLQADVSITRVEVLDLTGKVVNVQAPAHNTVAVEQLPEGMYLLRIYSQQGVQVRKVLVAR